MKKNTPTKYLFKTLLVFMSLFLFSTVAQATTGGPTFIHSFKYNPNDESVYFISTSFSGRGCPPVLEKMSLNTGEYQTVYSCDQGEKLLASAGYDNSRVYNEINSITRNFKDLAPISLKKNNITIDIDFIKSEKLSPELNEIKNSIFSATIYQDDKKIKELSFSGCNTDQPFTFAGYAIPGFEKKIVLLLSTKGDCMEGGYINESLFVLGGISVSKDYINSFKGESALSPDEGTLVVFAGDKIENIVKDTYAESVVNKNNKLILPIILLSLLVGFILGRITKKKI